QPIDETGGIAVVASAHLGRGDVEAVPRGAGGIGDAAAETTFAGEHGDAAAAGQAIRGRARKQRACRATAHDYDIQLGHFRVIAVRSGALARLRLNSPCARRPAAGTRRRKYRRLWAWP